MGDKIRKLESAGEVSTSRRKALQDIAEVVGWTVAFTLGGKIGIDGAKHTYRKYKFERLPEDTDANKLLGEFHKAHKANIDVNRGLVIEGARTAFVMIGQSHGNPELTGNREYELDDERSIQCQKEIYQFLIEYLKSNPETKVYEEGRSSSPNNTEQKLVEIIHQLKKGNSELSKITGEEESDAVDRTEHATHKILPHFPDSIVPIENESLLNEALVEVRDGSKISLLGKIIAGKDAMITKRNRSFVVRIGTDKKIFSLFVLGNAHNLESEVENWNTEHPEEKISFLVYTPDSLK